MLNLININKPILVNDELYSSSQQAYEALKDYTGPIRVQILPGEQIPVAPQPFKPKVKRSLADAYAQFEGVDITRPEPVAVIENEPSVELYSIQVKKWMTEKSSPGFDFMLKWNNDVPMPLVIMKGRILEETKGMYLMDLYAEPEASTVCFKCGRALKHPVSVLYGIGPECGGHFYINPLNSEEQLQKEIENIREQMAKLNWKGWVIKSAVKEMKVIQK